MCMMEVNGRSAPGTPSMLGSIVHSGGDESLISVIKRLAGPCQSYPRAVLISQRGMSLRFLCHVIRK